MRALQLRLASCSAVFLGIATAAVAQELPQSADANTQSGFEPRLFIGETYVDNLALVDPNASKQDDFVTQVNPGFNWRVKRPRFYSYVDYTLQSLFYADNSDLNQVYNQLLATATGELAENLFFLEGSAVAVQQVVDPTQPVNIPEKIFDTSGNLTDSYTAHLTPYLRHRFGSGLVVDARYTYGFVKYHELDNTEDLNDSVDQQALFSLGTDEESPPRLSWKVAYDHENADYENSLPFRYDQASVELGYAATRELRLIARAGYESDLTVDTTDGGLDESYWLAGFEYEAGHGNRLRAMGGQRFFGTTYDVAYEYSGRQLMVNLHYVDGPETAAHELMIRPVTEQAQTPVPISGTDLTVVSSDLYVRKDFEGSMTLTGRRTKIEVHLRDYRRRYLTRDLADEFREAGAGLVRQLTARTDLALGANWSDYEIEDGGGAVDDLNLSVDLRRRITETLRGSLSLGRQERSGDFSQYDANWITLSVTKTF
jgi:hypothetical protein